MCKYAATAFRYHLLPNRLLHNTAPAVLLYKKHQPDNMIRGQENTKCVCEFPAKHPPGKVFFSSVKFSTQQHNSK